jgi:hypothetical protein
MGFTKRNKKKITKQNEILLLTKRNEISLFLLFRETSEISRNKCFVSLCFVFREQKKRMRNGNPSENIIFLKNVMQDLPNISAIRLNHKIAIKISWDYPFNKICIQGYNFYRYSYVRVQYMSKLTVNLKCPCPFWHLNDVSCHWPFKVK